jgi:hypothetical protein
MELYRVKEKGNFILTMEDISYVPIAAQVDERSPTIKAELGYRDVQRRITRKTRRSEWTTKR